MIAVVHGLLNCSTIPTLVALDTHAAKPICHDPCCGFQRDAAPLAPPLPDRHHHNSTVRYSIASHHVRVVQVCEAGCPEAPEAEYQLQLQVAQSQEDYIRGRLPHNPYLSGDTGPLMRDVKNFICTQLDMAGKHGQESGVN